MRTFFRLFLECLRRIMLPVIITAGVITALSVTLDGSVAAATYMCVVIPYVTVPIIAVMEYSYLFRRKASDFYHSLPIRREGLFLAGYLAAIVGIVFCFAVPLSTMLSIYMVSKTDTIGIVQIVKIISGLFGGSVYILGIVVFASSMTGMYVPACINSGLLLFVPATAIHVFQSAFFKRAPIMAGSEIIDSVFEALPGVNGSLTKAGTYLLIGIIYAVLAFMIFKRRKSETAGQSAPNRIMKYVFSAFMCFTICLIPFSDFLKGESFTAGKAMFYGIAVICAIAWELIFSRQIANVRHAFVSVGVTALALVISAVTFFQAVSYCNNLEIDVAAAKVGFTNGYQVWNGTTGLFQLRVHEPAGNFTAQMCYDYVSDDLEVVEIVEKSYKNSCENGGTMQTEVLLIGENGKKYKRNINISDEDMRRISQIFNKDPEYIELNARMPEVKDVRCVSVIKDYTYKDVPEEIYATYLEEMMGIEARNRIRYKESINPFLAPFVTRYSSTVKITVNGYYKGMSFTETYSVSETVHTKTYELIMKEQGAK